MPADPTPAQSAAARANGRRSRGAKTAEGRARLQAAATRHNLWGPFRLLPGEDAAYFERLRRAWHERLRPADRAEAAAVDAIVAQIWRQGRLDVIEVQLLTALLDDRPTTGLPSLDTICRYRARLDRERRLAEEELERLRRTRPPAPDPDAFRPIWLPELAAALAAPAQPGWDSAAEPDEPEEPSNVVPLRPRPH